MYVRWNLEVAVIALSCQARISSQVSYLVRPGFLQVTEMESELEDQKALAASRLQEIEKLRAEKVDLAVKVDELKIQV